MSGLHTASTVPLPRARISAPQKSIQNAPAPVAKISASDPMKWQSIANRIRFFMPRASTSGPSAKIESVNPQSAAPPMYPTCSLLSANSPLRGPMIAPITAKHTDVEIREKQLPRKRRSRFMGSS
jgi:hypothetical protein